MLTKPNDIIKIETDNEVYKVVKHVKGKGITAVNIFTKKKTFIKSGSGIKLISRVG